jgi:hypothetical protein
MYSPLLSILSFLISLSTASGIMLHDTRIDKATAAAVAAPLSLAQYDTGTNKGIQLGNDAHTHIERSAFSQAMRVYQTSTPGVQPRSDDRKHMMQKHIPKGHHAFDNYNLPIV